MTPKEAKVAFEEFTREIGPRADVYIDFNRSGVYGDGALYVSIYPVGITGSNNELRCSAAADDWPELLAAGRAKWDEHKDRHRQQTIRKIAIEIIRLTADLGECTDAALRETFNPGDLAAYGAAAVEDANKIASNGPFSIKRKRGANAA